MNRKQITVPGGLAAGALLFFLPLAGGCGPSENANATPAATTATTAAATSVAAAPVVQTPATKDAATLQNAFVQVAKFAGPAVVTITTERRLPPPSSRGFWGPQPFGGPRAPFNGNGPDPFEEFFRRFGGGGGPFGFEPSSAQTGFQPAQQQGRPGGGLGSGFVYGANGLILTNAHVVRDADTVTVKLADGREFKNAKVLGEDARTDVAVVKVDATDLPTVKLGDSSRVQVGEWAIAVGNPFGLEKTLTVGVISATARDVPLTEAGPGDYLQTDASINPGNSGGPLLDIQGRVVGVNNAIFSRTGGNVGIGFAIPINTAKEIADVLAKEGRVRRARLGVGVADLEAQAAAAFGLDSSTRGALVQTVEPNGPAARAGIQPGDVITQINGTPVQDAGDLQQRVSRSPIGSTVTLTILRGGKTRTVTARLAELEPGEGEVPPAPSPGDADGSPSRLGLQIAALTPELARRAGLSPSARGVLIVGVQNGSPAAEMGLRPGDLIERVGQTAVTTPAQVQAEIKRILGKQTGDTKNVALYVNRRGERRFVIVGLNR